MRVIARFIKRKSKDFSNILFYETYLTVNYN